MILSGRGSTTVWNDAGQRMTFEWKAGALFAIPLNCWHQHFNGSGRDPARFVSVTNAPIVINLYEDLDFIFGTNYDFKGRFNGEPDYFSAKDETKGFLLATNFVPDAVNLPLITAKERGAGGGHIRFNFAKSSLNSHISQFPIGTYKKAHAHGPGAHVIILSGEGYSLMWPEGDKPRYYKWEVGTMIVPPNMWLHQHFNTGTTPARYLAFKHEGVAIRNAQGVPKAWISKRLGGDQIDYSDENPETRKEFEQRACQARPQVGDGQGLRRREGGSGAGTNRGRGEGSCMMSQARPTGMSRPAASAPASASSAGRRRPTTTSWSRKASRCFATSASARCRTCRSRHGSAPAAAAATSSSTAPKANGAATSSRCRAPARSIPRSTSTRKSISSSKAAAPPKSGSTTITSATCSNGRRARCSRSRSTPCTASSTPRPRRRCCSPAPPRRT